MSASHEHDEDCRALRREWQRCDTLARDASGRLDANDRGNAVRERVMFERQLRARGCSTEALARHD